MNTCWTFKLAWLKDPAKKKDILLLVCHSLIHFKVELWNVCIFVKPFQTEKMV